MQVIVGTIDADFGVLVDRLATEDGTASYWTRFILEKENQEHGDTNRYLVWFNDRVELTCRKVAITATVPVSSGQLRRVFTNEWVTTAESLNVSVAEWPGIEQRLRQMAVAASVTTPRRYPRCDASYQSVPDIPNITATSIRDCDRNITYSL